MTFQKNLSEQPIPTTGPAVPVGRPPVKGIAKAAAFKAASDVIVEGLKLFKEYGDADTIKDYTNRTINILEGERQGTITPIVARQQKRSLSIQAQRIEDPARRKVAVNTVASLLGNVIEDDAKRARDETNRFIDKGKERLGPGKSDAAYRLQGVESVKEKRRHEELKKQTASRKELAELDEIEQLRLANNIVRTGSAAWIPYLRATIANTDNIKTVSDYKIWQLDKTEELNRTWRLFETAIHPSIQNFNSKEAKESARASMKEMKATLMGIIDSKEGLRGTTGLLRFYQRLTTQDNINFRDALGFSGALEGLGEGFIHMIASQQISVEMRQKIAEGLQGLFKDAQEKGIVDTPEAKKLEEALSIYNLLQRHDNPDTSGLEYSPSVRSKLAEAARQIVRTIPVNKDSSDKNVEDVSRQFFSVVNIGTNNVYTTLNAGIFLDIVNNTSAFNKIEEITLRNSESGGALQRGNLRLAAKTLRLGIQSYRGDIEYNQATQSWSKIDKDPDDVTETLDFVPGEDLDKKGKSNIDDIVTTMNNALDALDLYRESDKGYMLLGDTKTQKMVVLASLGAEGMLTNDEAFQFKKKTNLAGADGITKPSTALLQKDAFKSTYAKRAEVTTAMSREAIKVFEGISKGRTFVKNRDGKFIQPKRKQIPLPGLEVR
jgi:hypothetical protein